MDVSHASILTLWLLNQIIYYGYIEFYIDIYIEPTKTFVERVPDYLTLWLLPKLYFQIKFKSETI